ncbi:MAG TPA: response regulator transcription factor [Dehalococcoidia bacterium]|nr:response regulator transcription factor [Dehalococcoidia bacterium]
MTPVSVLVADNHTLFREGLCRLLRDEPDLQVVASVATGEQAVQLVQELKPDIALVDVDLPDISGCDVCRRIVASQVNTAVILLSECDYQTNVLAALQAGAASYLLKCSRAAEVCSAIRLVCSGQAVIDLQAIARAVHTLAEGGDGRSQSPAYLRPREVEILKLAAKGIHNREIAMKLGISERTVQSHLLNVFHRWHVNSRTEAVFRALREGLLSIEDLP